ncbi:hypothetical protein BDN71DRAFT_1441910 [Pleurotus eryngii]|uniref:Uncharacterized protein n=1 Tax=Pleurotus eryngii TaxID=5323 RepID=A0A9P6A7U4_PLEER|nr:hypothetical protein BDN71DRAFT_1441910 [Pleurotus eryngii]
MSSAKPLGLRPSVSGVPCSRYSHTSGYQLGCGCLPSPSRPHLVIQHTNNQLRLNGPLEQASSPLPDNLMDVHIISIGTLELDT